MCQQSLEEASGHSVSSEEVLPRDGIGSGSGAKSRRQLDSEFLSQKLEGLAKLHLVKLADETNGIPAGTADKAVENLLVWDDSHAGVVVVMERAEALELASCGLELNVLADYLNNVCSISHFGEVVLTAEMGATCIPHLAFPRSDRSLNRRSDRELDDSRGPDQG
jgi:hypothetical protein